MLGADPERQLKACIVLLSCPSPQWLQIARILQAGGRPWEAAAASSLLSADAPPDWVALQAASNVQQRDVAFWEINEAFSVVDIVNQRLLELNAAR